MIVLIRVHSNEQNGIPTLDHNEPSQRWLRHILEQSQNEGVCPIVDAVADHTATLVTSHLRGGFRDEAAAVKYRRIHNQHSLANGLEMLAQSVGSVLYIDSVTECEFSSTSSVINSWKRMHEQYRPILILVHHISSKAKEEKPNESQASASWRELNIDEFLLAQDITPNHEIDLHKARYTHPEIMSLFRNVYTAAASTRPVTQGRLIDSILTVSEHVRFQDDTLQTLIDDGFIEASESRKSYEERHLEEAHRLTSYLERMIKQENEHIERRAKEESERFIERRKVASQSGEVTLWEV